MSDEEIAAEWPTFRASALVHDLGPAGLRASATLDALERGMFASVSIPAATPQADPVAPSTEITIVVRGASGACTIMVGEGASARTLPCSASTADIRAAVPEPRGPAPRAVIDSDPDVAYADVVRVIDALRAAGYSRVGLSLDPIDPHR